MPIKLGNIRERSFLGIWHNSPVLKELRDRSLLKGHCAECENKFICGGCRARAWAYFKDLCAPDPGCINNMKYWEEIVRR
jgi:radical SAM protein with 4Fe4S-binding SPASM domain